MSEALVQLVTDAANTGKKVRCVENTVSGQVVEQQVVTLAKADGTLLELSGTALPVGGDVASDSADSGYPVKIGGKYDATPPTLTDGDRGDVMVDVNGRILVVASGTAAAAATDSGNPIKVGGRYTTTTPALTTDQRGDLMLDENSVLKVAALTPGIVKSVGATVAASTNSQTLASAANKFAYLAGFAITGLGATSAAAIEITTTGLTGNLSFTFAVPAGATVAATPLIVTFNPPLRASATGTSIVVVVPSFGVGNLTASASAWGFLE